MTEPVTSANAPSSHMIEKTTTTQEGSGLVPNLALDSQQSQQKSDFIAALETFVSRVVSSCEKQRTSSICGGVKNTKECMFFCYFPGIMSDHSTIKNIWTL